ncbi:MAG TPA: nucleotide-binding domain containing protein, partial [Candidatus Bathyarchaeia archaeon]|nr:nucleotide-binding domain containing protein [Candidatus Bathyarchaeia archaeon]
RINSSKLTDIICSQSKNPINNILLSTVRRGHKSIANRIRQESVKGVQILCIDAKNRADLRNIAAACRMVHALPCGSAGLAEEIAADLFQPVQRRPVVALCASTNKVTLNEIQRSTRSSKCMVIVANATQFVSDESSRQHEISRIQRLVKVGYARSKYVIVTSALSNADVERARHIKINKRRARADIVRGLAASVAPLLSTSFDCGVVLTGGEMAAAFLTQIGARGARVETELAPGIIVGKIEGGRLDGMSIVTKAGGFGLPGTLLSVMRYLSTEKTSNQTGVPK